MGRDPRTALIVPVVGLPDAVDRWREQTCLFKPSAGVPPHVTIVFPFVSAPLVSDSLSRDLAELFRGRDRFAFDLDEVRRFPAALYLAPRPFEPFVSLSEAVADRYPECEPHVHAFGEVVPHLTTAEGTADVMDAAEKEITPLLPIRAACDSAVLLVETSTDPSRWSARMRFCLGRPPRLQRLTETDRQS